MALGHDGEEESDDVDSALQKSVGEALGKGRVVEHDGDDGRFAVFELESGFAQACLEASHVVHQAVAQLGGAVEQVEYGEAGSDDGWGEAVAKEVGARALAEHFDELLAAGGESAHGAAEGFAEGSGNDVDAAENAAQLDRTTSGGANESGGVALVDHDEGVVLVGQVADAVHLGDVAVH